MAEIKYKAEGKVQVSSRLNVRKGNGTGTSIIGKLYSGNTVKITHKTDDKKFNDQGTMRNGYKIEYKGSVAYVCERYVKITKEYKDEAKTETKTPDKPVQSSDTYILTGTAEVEPNLALRVGHTVNLQGLGKYLSGAYYVEEITYSIGKDGIKQSLSLSKNAFGESINTPPPLKEATTTTPPKPAQQEVAKPKEEKKRTHKLKRGESLWSLAKTYYKDGTKWPVIAKANGIDPNNDRALRTIPDGKELTIPYL